MLDGWHEMIIWTLIVVFDHYYIDIQLNCILGVRMVKSCKNHTKKCGSEKNHTRKSESRIITLEKVNLA